MRPVFGLLAALTLATGTPARAQTTTTYERRELSIPMRDGVTLFAVALIPEHAGRPLPIILVRTPFSAAREFRNAEPPLAYRELAEDGYIFVNEDIRGRFGSGGSFVTMRPQHPGGVDESTDAWDTIDWLVKNLPDNNGRVGVRGISYRGWLAALAGVGAHPALKAISPQAPVADVWLGDDFFHQGAFRQTQGVAIAAFLETDQGLSPSDDDQFAFYRRFPTLDSLARATGVGATPSWTGFVAHPAYDAYWQERALQNVLTKPEVPTLFVGGWWDEEDILGAPLAYHTVEKADTGGLSRIVLGPWSHGGWAQPSGDSIGPIPLGSSTAKYFRAEIERPWFAYFLHGKGDGTFPEAWAFATGENRWHTYDAWPPRAAAPRNLYLREGGRLSFDPPRASDGKTSARARSAQTHTPQFDGYIADPEHPVPYIPRPDDGSGWRTWLEQDQRFVDNRPDVLTWQSEPLTEDLTIAGDVVARLFASTTGTDADWVVKLIDVYPDTLPEHDRMSGYQLIVNADILRGRYWKNFGQATPIPAGTVTPFRLDLHEQFYRFLKGHRLMVQVQSSWFPLYDRNPQTFVANIFRAKPGDFRAQEHRIWHTARHPSHLILPVLP